MRISSTVLKTVTFVVTFCDVAKLRWIKEAKGDGKLKGLDREETNLKENILKMGDSDQRNDEKKAEEEERKEEKVT